ncbi:MAG TPA: O-antigen ligase family protein [Candidatus Binataceae bacterium]|nr:O-antigen ligase family protein [Candidatus Binataceae bacterium]
MLVLVVVSPFAFGSVHPLAYKPLEAALFGLACVWCFKSAGFIRIGVTGAGAELPGPLFLAIPMLAFAVWTVLQIVPLPPSVIGALSPNTYQIYAHTLDGWPQAAPYRALTSSAPVAIPVPRPKQAGPVVLPTRNEVENGASVPFAPRSADSVAVVPKPVIDTGPSVSHLAGWIYGGRWRPLTLAPVLTFSSLLVLLASGCAFFLAAFYPFGESDKPAAAEARFARTMLRALLATGFAIAFVGLIQRATWNGKLLWFFVPYDWGNTLVGQAQRACGPFVDPDHFAGYLAMIFPLALACAVFPNVLAPRRASAAFRVQCAVAAFVIFVAVLLSLSRAGWLGLMVGTTVMFVLALPGGAAEFGPESAPVRITGVRLAILGIVGLLCAAVMFIGPAARVETAARFNETTSGIGTIAERITTWRGGLRLIRDFPLFGVGLGAWPEIFSRYQLPPWTQLFADEAHNDYLQLIAESGVVGILLCGWAVARVMRAIASGWRRLNSATLPVIAAIVAGIAAMGAIELFDFDLRIPALGLLLAVMAGVALRIVRIASAADWEIAAPPPRIVRSLALTGGAVAAGLVVAALAQNSKVYPYNLRVPRSLAEARDALVTYPANSLPHLGLAFIEHNPAVRDAEFARAVWLDPLSPEIRDRYARALVIEGKPAEALEQIRRSLLYCPSFLPQSHPYLVPRLILWFPPALKEAVEQGLAEAVERGYPQAPQSLGDYYSMFGRYADEARMYARVGRRVDDPVTRARYLKQAGEAYVRAGDPDAALLVFRQAADAMPDDSTIYADMAALVYGPRHDLAGAERVAAQGIENGADPYVLSVAVGDAALAAGSLKKAEKAYEQALEYRPDAYDLLIRLSSVYASDSRPERAILTLNRAAEVRPDAAGTYYEIARLEEGRYHYYEAEQDYRQAVRLSPGNPQFQDGLAEFEHKLKAESAAEHIAPTP